MRTKEIHLDVKCIDRVMAAEVRKWLAEQNSGPCVKLTATEPDLDDLQATDPLVVGLLMAFSAQIADGSAKELGKQLVVGVAELLRSLYQRIFGRPVADQSVNAVQKDTAGKIVTVRLSQRQVTSIILSEGTTRLEIERYAEIVVDETGK